MLTYLIDPATRTITPLHLDDSARSSCEPFYAPLACDTIEMVQLGAGVALVIDEEGWLKEPGEFFALAGPGQAPRYFAGKGLLCATTPRRQHTTDMPLGFVAAAKRAVLWPTLEEVRAFRDGGGLDGAFTTYAEDGSVASHEVMPFRPTLADER